MQTTQNLMMWRLFEEKTLQLKQTYIVPNGSCVRTRRSHAALMANIARFRRRSCLSFAKFAMSISHTTSPPAVYGKNGGVNPPIFQLFSHSS